MNIAMTQPIPTMITLTLFSLVLAYFLGKKYQNGEAKEIRHFRRLVAVIVVVYVQSLLWQVTQHAPAKQIRSYDKPVEAVTPLEPLDLGKTRIEAVQSFEDKLNEMRKRNEED